MANRQSNIFQLLKGMDSDLHPMRMEDGAYEFMLNGVLEGFDGNGFPEAQNEPSNLLCSELFDAVRVVGSVNIIEQNRVLLFMVSDDGDGSFIYEVKPEFDFKSGEDGYVRGNCDNCESITVSERVPLEKLTPKPHCTTGLLVANACLNFNIGHPVKAVYRILPCGLEVFFTDNFNGERHIEFDYQDDDVSKNLVVNKNYLQITGFTEPCNDPVYGEIDCNKLLIQPAEETPCINYLDQVGGGSLKGGVYQFFIAFSDSIGNKRSSYISATNPIPVRTKDITLDNDYVTDRAISLSIDNLNPSGPFEYYNLAVAETINGTTAFYLVGTFPITQNRFTYTGNDVKVKLSVDTIFARSVYYKTVGDLTASNNILFKSNLAEFPKPNWQRVANNIILQWQTIAIPEAAYRDPRNSTKFRSAMRDEVYPYGIQFIYDNLEETNAYHIPGRIATENDREIVENNDVITDEGCYNEISPERWRVYNTGTLEGGDLNVYDGCNESCYQYGNFAYWESTRTYPNDPVVWGDLCGQPIRHHKFPDSLITHIHDREAEDIVSSGGTFAQNNLVFPIGVKVDHDSIVAAISQAVEDNIITAADAARVVGYRILRGNRFGHKSIKAKGLLFDVNQYTRFWGSSAFDLEPIYFANYPYNDLHANGFITNQHDNYKDHNTPVGDDLPFTFSKRYTFHSPDTHFSEPNPGTEIRLETAEYGEAEGFFTKSRNQAKQKLLSNTSYFLALAAGIIAALLRTQEKTCVTYTIKSDYTLNYGDQHVGNASFNTGQDITGLLLGIGAGTITTVNAGGSIGSHTISQDDTTEKHNADSFTGYDPTTGQPTTINNAESHTQTTCQGTRNQYYNGLLAYLQPALEAFQSVLTFVGQAEDFARVVLNEMNIILELIKSLTPYRDWCVQYDSIGKYNLYVPVSNIGNKRRKLQTYAYLKPENSIVNEVPETPGEPTTIKFNNFERESSLYLRYLGVDLQTPDIAAEVIDTSRVAMNNPLNDCSLDKKFYTPICSYYASLKEYIPDQYGDIYNIEYLETDSCDFVLGTTNTICRGVYGGDTFINRFALKIKVPYFLATTFGLPPGTDFDYSEYANLAYPRNYYNNTLTLGSEFQNIGDILTAIDIFDPDKMFDIYGRPKSIRDCDTSKLFYQNGYIYLYHYGIPYFFAESDVNVDYRVGTNNKEGDFYPHQGNLDFWLQEENVPIREDNTYFYNKDYSKQNKETFIGIDGPKFEPDRECRVAYPNRIAYSTDNYWLTTKPNDFYDFPLTGGKLTAIDGIENDAVIIRSENSYSIIRAILRTQVDGQTVQIGNAGIFQNPPQQFAVTNLGYMGSQHKALLQTEFGHIWVDSRRGQVFNLAGAGEQVDEISRYGKRNWFKRNLPFRMEKDFTNLPQGWIDNNFRGVGITLAFDKRFSRFILTKRDYKVRDTRVQYDPVNDNFFYMEGEDTIVVELTNKKFFKDISWTISYSFLAKRWVSYHSYKPEYYLNYIDSFASGKHGSGVWTHNKTNSSYQVFYGELYPFVVEPLIRFTPNQTNLQSIEFDTEVRRYEHELDYIRKKGIPGFNKSVIYNDIYNTGLLNLKKIDKSVLSLTGIYPLANIGSWDIEVAIADYKWRYNQFYNLARDYSELPLWNYDENNVDKTLNPLAIDYKKSAFSLSRMRGQWYKVRLVNDLLSNYNVIMKFGDYENAQDQR